ncbi:MAG: thioesterase family protein [Desulfobacterales bacterium]|nr:thioesterase family protein [Desulfobacterales bacterium]
MEDVRTDFDTLLAILKDLYEEKLPFNRVLGLRVKSMSPDQVRVGFEMKETLIGNFRMEILHGGVISSTLDATGGLMASIGLLKKMAGRPLDEIARAFTHIGTIDLRIDYLRPGRGEFFLSSASTLRIGRKVAVTRMELHNNEDLLIAVGTGTYIVG